MISMGQAFFVVIFFSMHFKKQTKIYPKMLVPKNVQYCTLNCERRQISKCLDVTIEYKSVRDNRKIHHISSRVISPKKFSVANLSCQKPQLYNID